MFSEKKTKKNDLVNFFFQIVIILARKVAEVAKETKQPITGVKTLHVAVTKLRTCSEALTPIHADFVLLCLLSKTYHVALPILEDEIFETSVEAQNTPRDVLLYFYYGGMAYIGAKDLRKAYHFLKLVKNKIKKLQLFTCLFKKKNIFKAVTMPSSVLSSIMIEAYKKLILVSLLLHGHVIFFFKKKRKNHLIELNFLQTKKAPSLPKYSSNALQRHLKTVFPPYQEFANAYSTFNTDDLHKVAETYAEVFQKVKNKKKTPFLF